MCSTMKNVHIFPLNNECLPCASGSTVLRGTVSEEGIVGWADDEKVSMTVTLPKDPMPGPPTDLAHIGLAIFQLEPA